MILAPVTSPEGYGAAAFVLVICAFVLRWTNRHQKDWLDECQAELDKVREELRRSSWRFEQLVDACRRAGVAIPPSVWTGRPDDEPPHVP